ncbi:MAG: hypothetical protein ACYTFA_12455, partial [Planctomycetota bacterium]
MNISLPGDLRDRMDRVEEAVNWSPVACRAFGAMLKDNDCSMDESAKDGKRTQWQIEGTVETVA